MSAVLEEALKAETIMLSFSPALALLFRIMIEIQQRGKGKGGQRWV